MHGRPRLHGALSVRLAAGRPAGTAALVTSLRDFIRDVLELDPIPASLAIPKQGPLRSPGGRDKAGGGTSRSGGGKGAADSGGFGGGTGGGVGGGIATHHSAGPDDGDAESH